MSAKHNRAYSDAYETGRLFTLRIPGQLKGEPMVIIDAFDGNYTDPMSGHQRIDIRVRQGCKVIFEKGDTWCAVNRWATLDGKEAKELVVSTAATKPGATDDDFFENYTPEQLDWASANGEYLSMIAEERYGQP